ncbi:MAG: hypothetical protein ACRDQI_14080 [Pseudonocardiaceae bacterium]
MTCTPKLSGEGEDLPATDHRNGTVGQGTSAPLFGVTVRRPVVGVPA